MVHMERKHRVKLRGGGVEDENVDVDSVDVRTTLT